MPSPTETTDLRHPPHRGDRGGVTMLMRRNRILVLSLVLATVSLAFVGSSQARTTNVAQLDDGTCGRNLQIGSDKTSSSTATPQFLLWGDGGASRYDIFIDGT